MQKTKLQKILEALSPDKTRVDFAEFDESVNKLKQSLKEKVQAQTLADVNRKLDKFRASLDLTPIIDSVSKLEENVNSNIQEVTMELSNAVSQLDSLLAESHNQNSSLIESLQSEIAILNADLARLIDQKNTEIKTISTQVADIQSFNTNSTKSLNELISRLEDLQQNKVEILETKIDTSAFAINSDIEKLRKELLSKISTLQASRGGNANRNIAIGGNSSVLSKYTDINIKAGSNVTLTYSNNNTTKQLDLTIASSGGGGSVAGTVRSINRVATSQTMGSVAGTDYVYIATAGIRLTLPDATGITNQYTVKNVSVSSVLISTTASQTIDTDSEIILPIQFTSVDLINDGADDWSIT